MDASSIGELFIKEQDKLFNSLVAKGATKEEIKEALKALVRQQHLSIICVDQDKPSTN